MDANGVLCIQVNESIAEGCSKDDLQELSVYYGNLVQQFVQEEGPQAQYMMEQLEPPTFNEANVHGFNLRDHYYKKQE